MERRQSRAVQNRSVCATWSSIRRSAEHKHVTRPPGRGLVFRPCCQGPDMPRHSAAPTASEPLHVSIVAISEAAVSTLTGVFDVMNAFSMLSRLGDASFDRPPFRVEIVGLRPGPLERRQSLACRRCSGVSARSTRPTSSSFPPSCLERRAGRRAGIRSSIDWFRAMHRRGALLCSACSGIFLLAETGLFDGMECDRALRLRPRLSQQPSRRCRSTPSASWSSPASARS